MMTPEPPGIPTLGYRQGHQGFSLLEVLVALAVAGIGLSAALGLSARQLDNQAHLEQQILARWVAANQLAELQLTGGGGADELDGEAKMGGLTWYWQAFAEDSQDRGIRRLRVQVSRDAEGVDRHASLTGYYRAQTR